MSAKLIDGKVISDFFRSEYKLRVDRLIAAGVRPGLAVVIVGDDAASQVYVRNKAKACDAIGMHSEIHALPATTTYVELQTLITAC
jgi:methylenetetrahydrofolate dehydrogenase (NADP+) / methenyltetrahydrofolate cyclohydrolase